MSHLTNWSLDLLCCKETRPPWWKTDTHHESTEVRYPGIHTCIHTPRDPECLSVGGGVMKNRTSCSSLTVTVLAWLLINWHCACHTRHLVGRRPLWHQYRSSSGAQLEVLNFLAKCFYTAPCPAPAVNLLWMRFGNCCWAPSLIRGSVWRGVCCGCWQQQQSACHTQHADCWGHNSNICNVANTRHINHT